MYNMYLIKYAGPAPNPIESLHAVDLSKWFLPPLDSCLRQWSECILTVCLLPSLLGRAVLFISFIALLHYYPLYSFFVLLFSVVLVLTRSLALLSFTTTCIYLFSYCPISLSLSFCFSTYIDSPLSYFVAIIYCFDVCCYCLPFFCHTLGQSVR